MTNELGDVLGAAEAATERGLPAFDHVVMAKDVNRRTKRRRTMREAGTGFLATVAVGALGLGGFLAYDHFKDVTPVVPPDVSSTTGPVPSPTTGDDWPDVADREVTMGDGIPDAVALTGEALGSVDTGWVLAIYDSTYYRGMNEPIPGKRVLYLISPQGERFEVANLTEYGSPHLAAWDTDRQVAFIVENQYVTFTVDLASGEVANEKTICGQDGSIKATDLPGDRWLLRGNCEGEGIDGIYTDDATLVTQEGIEKGGGFFTVYDIGDVQVRYESEMPPAESYVAVHADGTKVAMLPVGDEVQCFPQGPSLAGGVAVTCWGEGDIATIWNLDLNGGEPTLIAGPDTLNAIESALGEALPYEGVMLNSYRLAGDQEVISVGGAGTWVAVLGEDSPIVLTNGESWADWCYGGVGQTVLVSGLGALWTWDASTGVSVDLLPMPVPPEPQPGADGEWAGPNEGGAIIHP
jgi:hypothetical protein